ncbi:hypothetical protein VTK73DRAFT_7501 [Phialemonium thermophilum]|uniref:Tyrosinase copper-binding domain-containing protein n=1 Tax=Phialemonium thermophilum TaxID=223376 RepID=A0ABR3WER5_9PEZI
MLTSSVVTLCSLLMGARAGRVLHSDILSPARNGLFEIDEVDRLRDATMPKVVAWMATKAGSTNCTLENAAVRREWSDLSVAQREEYVQAVLCLQKKPPKAPRDKVPGSLSRYDDFVATHITQAMLLHDPNHLFASHKYFIWSFEKALREECGYTGYQPYMNYNRYAADPINSPLFNGNSSSIGGNGAPDTYGGVPMPFRRPYDKIPPAGAGGCVTEGPFKDMVVSLGPMSTYLNGIPKNPRPDGLGSNPRCLRRDVNKFSIAGATANYTYMTIMNNTKIDDFYNRYLGQPPLKNDPHPTSKQLHNAGHYTIGGGDPGGDFYASPGDPMFWFHHGMLDRVWWLWQMQDPENRVHLIPGNGAQQMNMKHKTRGDAGEAATDPGETIVDLGWTAPPAKLKDLNDQLGGLNGQFCYYYA